jgi:hypothetical protein
MLVCLQEKPQQQGVLAYRVHLPPVRDVLQDLVLRRGHL